MIQKKEMRLGNLVQFSELSPVRKELVGTPVELTENEMPFVYSSPDYYDPIPITPEILEKAVFVWNRDKAPHSVKRYWFLEGLRYDFVNRKISILRSCDKAGESQPDICGHSMGDNIPIKSLHQLQNLYFALTGQELEIKL